MWALGGIRVSEAVVVPGHTTELTVEDAGKDTNWQLETESGEVVARGHVPVGRPRSTVNVKVPSAGYFEISVQDSDSEKRLALAALDQGNDVDLHFGVMTHFAQGWPISLVPLIARLGVRTVRDEIYWGSVELQPGDYKAPLWAIRYMAELKRVGIEPFIILSFGNRNYDSGFAPYTDKGRSAFAAYADHLVSLFESQIRAVEVWNEYNGQFCTGPCVLDRSWFYTAMLKQTADLMHVRHPGVRVIGISSDHTPTPYFQDLAKVGAFDTLDAISIHPYREIEETIADDISALRRISAPNGTPKPIWATEFGVQGRSRLETADYLVRSTVLLLADNVERMYWYLFMDFGSGTGMGLIRSKNDELGPYSPTPAYSAYGSLIRLLGDHRFVRRLPFDDRTYAFEFMKGNRKTYVAWSTSGTASLCYDSASASALYNVVGRPITPIRSSQYYCVSLGPSPVLITGGDELIEHRDNRLLASSLEPLIGAATNGRFSAGYYNMTTGAETTDVGVHFTRWGSYLGADKALSLAISGTSMRSGLEGPDRLAPFRRWTSNIVNRVQLEGYFEKPDMRGDAVSAVVRRDGQEVYRHLLTGAEASRSFRYSVVVPVSVGTQIDFALEPSGSPAYGDVILQFFISALLD